MSSLNKEQREAVLATDGAVVVIAGAGSGKTRVLTSRITYLVESKGVNPANILAITFTNKAAAEMLERVVAMVGECANSMWISTIHSMCVRILRNSVGRLEGYSKNFTVYSEVDREHVLKRIIADLKLEGENILKNAKYHISNAKNNDLSPERYSVEGEGASLDTYVKIYQAYEETLQKSNAMDFDDLLLKTLHLLQDDEEVLSYYANKFKYIHIDEFQDTNAIQYRIAKLLSSVHHNIFVVGDDDQSIYGWRGAEIKNILNFHKEFSPCKVIKLEQNYRSTKKILDLANTIIANNSIRNQKVLWTENDGGAKVECYIAEEESGEAEYVAAQVKNLVARRSCDYKDIAVLMRVNALSRSFEREFTKYAIPFKVFGGFKFYERKEIKDITAYLRLLINPLDDEAVLRIINTPKRGIGDKTINTLVEYAKSFNFSIFDALFELERIDGLSTSGRSRLMEFRRVISDLTIMQQTTTNIVSVVNEVLEKTSFMSQFEIETEENISKRMNIDEFRNEIEEYSRLNPKATLEDYLSSITLTSDIDEADSSNYVSVATIHAVKGLEFKTVFIVGLDETIFPITRAVGSPAELEEERRLMYVAITRACQRLYITRAKSRYLYGERQFTSQSRFLNEISEKLGISKPKPRETYPITSHVKTFNNEEFSSDFASTSTVGTSSISSFSKSYTSSIPKANNNAKDVSKFKAGKHVRHVKFGVGTIIQVKGVAPRITVDVAFKGYGVKSFSLLLAPMEVID